MNRCCHHCTLLKLGSYPPPFGGWKDDAHFSEEGKSTQNTKIKGNSWVPLGEYLRYIPTCTHGWYNGCIGQYGIIFRGTTARVLEPHVWNHHLNHSVFGNPNNLPRNSFWGGGWTVQGMNLLTVPVVRFEQNIFPCHGPRWVNLLFQVGDVVIRPNLSWRLWWRGTVDGTPILHYLRCINPCTPRKFNRSPLKNGGWKRPMFRGLPYMKIVWGVYLWEKTLPTIQIIKQQVCRVLAINPAPAYNKLIVEKLLDSYNIHFQPKTDGCSGAHHTWHLYYPVIFRIWGSFSSSFGRKYPSSAS